MPSPHAPVSEDRVAITPETAARIAGVTIGRLRYWDHTKVISPALSRRLSARNEVRLYSLRELVELRVVSALRAEGVSLQHIRKIVQRLRPLHDDPLATLVWAVGINDRQIYFQTPDGAWSGGKHPEQIVLERVIPLHKIRGDVLRAVSRTAEDRAAGEVRKVRNVLGSKPVFADTRVPVEGVLRWLASGASDERILAAYPALRREDLDAARHLAAEADSLAASV